jgi:hypothetical protein
MLSEGGGKGIAGLEEKDEEEDWIQRTWLW